MKTAKERLYRVDYAEEKLQKKKVAHPGRQCLIVPESIIFI